MKRHAFTFAALIMTARAAAALTATDSAIITATVPELVAVSVTGGPVSLNFTAQGVVQAGTYPVSGGSVAVVNNSAQAGDVTVQLQGSQSSAPGVLDGPAPAAGFLNVVNVASVVIGGVSSAPFPVNVLGGGTQIDVIPAFGEIPAGATSITLNVLQGSAPLVSGAYSGQATVTVTGS